MLKLEWFWINLLFIFWNLWEIVLPICFLQFCSFLSYIHSLTVNVYLLTLVTTWPKFINAPFRNTKYPKHQHQKKEMILQLCHRPQLSLHTSLKYEQIGIHKNHYLVELARIFMSVSCQPSWFCIKVGSSLRRHSVL